MSDVIFSPAAPKPKSAGEQAADRGPRNDPIQTATRRKRRTKAELAAAGETSKPRQMSELAVFRACLKYIRELNRVEAARVVEMLKAVIDA